MPARAGVPMVSRSPVKGGRRTKRYLPFEARTEDVFDFSKAVAASAAPFFCELAVGKT
jgi:hypothetical protein